MNRRELLKRSAALGLVAGIPSLAAGKLFAGTGGLQVNSATDKTKPVSNPLTPPAQGSIPVAFVISEGGSDHRFLWTMGCVRKCKRSQ